MGYIFTTESSKLIVTLNTNEGELEPNIKEYSSPSLVLGNDRIYLKENGTFVQNFILLNIEEIDGDIPLNLADAYELLENLIRNLFVVSSGGSEPAYKVYSNNLIIDHIIETSGSLVVGRKYYIANFQLGDDFSNVGGTNSSDTFFIASGTTPTTWSNSSELECVDVTNQVLKNTFEGTIEVSHDIETGLTSVTNDSEEFTDEKTEVIVIPNNDSNTSLVSTFWQRLNSNSLNIKRMSGSYTLKVTVYSS